MSKLQPCAIVIMYHGEVAREDHCTWLAKKIQDLLNCENLTISVIDHKSLIEMIGREKINIRESVKTIDETAIKNAIIFLGTMFAEQLNEGQKTSNYSKFALSLSLRMGDEKVRNAIEILATKSGSVSKNIFQKYKMSAGAFEVIRDIYGSYPGF